MSDSVRPHRRQPTRLPRPWDSQGENTGVGCRFLLQCVKVRSGSEVAQSCPCDLMDRSPPGSSIHGISRARELEWVPLPSLIYYLAIIYLSSISHLSICVSTYLYIYSLSINHLCMYVSINHLLIIYLFSYLNNLANKGLSSQSCGFSSSHVWM